MLRCFTNIRIIQERKMKKGRILLLCLFAVAVTPILCQADPLCNGKACVRNAGNDGLGFNVFSDNSCPDACSIVKFHAGSSCYGTLVATKYCTGSTTLMPSWFTTTTTCENGECDFSNSFWSESTVLTETPTCSMPKCIMGVA